MNKITCICLGVRDMERSIKFYRDGLGYKTDCKENNPPVIFFDTAGTKFELFPLEQLAKDIDESNPPMGDGFAGITLAYNVEHAYFADPDGYYWEVAWGPNFKFDEKGLLKF